MLVLAATGQGASAQDAQTPSESKTATEPDSAAKPQPASTTDTTVAFPTEVPRSTVEIQTQVTGVQGAELSLSAGLRQQLRVGMTLNVLDEQGSIIGKARVTSITASSSQATLAGQLPPGITPRRIVAPYPLTLTGIEQETVFFVLPRGSNQLKKGDPITVIRGGQPIATLEFNNYAPISALIKLIRPGTNLVEGDIAWAVAADSLKSSLDLAPFQPPAPPVPVFIPNMSGADVPSRMPTQPDEATSDNNGFVAPSPGDSSSPPIAPSTILSVRPSRPKRNRPLWLSRSGATGLIRMPSADTTADGEVQTLEFLKSAVKSPTDPNLGRIGGGTRYAASIGFLPRVELGLVVGEEDASRDLNFNAKVQVLKEAENRPAVAIGAAEIKKLAGQNVGVNYGTAYYLVASKDLLQHRMRASLGVASQNRIRPFGGLEVGLTPSIGAVVEHDGEDFNYGVKTSWLNNRLQVGANHITSGWAYQVGFNLPFGTRRSPVPVSDLPKLGEGLSQERYVAVLQERLIDAGLENVHVRILSPDTAATVSGGLGNRVEVTYENRSYPHNELDALAYVFAAASVYAPADVVRADVIVQRASLDLLHVAVPLDKYRSFVSGALGAEAFDDVLIVDYSSEFGVSFREVATTDVAAKPYGKADVMLRPRLRTALATEAYVLGLGLGVQPELDVPIARGVGLNIQGDIPLAGPTPVNGDGGSWNRFGLRLISRPSSSILLGGFIGRFADERSINPVNAGVGQALWRSDSGRIIARATAGLLDDPDGNGRNATYVGEANYYVSKLDLYARASAGQYINGDKGFVLGVMRRYGDTELGIEARDTDRGRVGLMRLAIPIGPNHLGNSPSRLRVRPADFFNYSLRSLLTSPNYLGVARRTGNELDLGPDLQTLLDRDRLTPAYVLRSVDHLRNVRGFRFPPVPKQAPAEITP